MTSFRRIRQMGQFVQERSGDYFRLFIVELEIQKQLLINRLVCLAVFCVFLFLSLIFLGIAVIFSFIHTPHIVWISWLVFFFYLLVLVVSGLIYMKNRSSRPIFYDIERELKQDIDMMKDAL